MTDFPLVSVVTPSFNQADFLEETIQSVISQDYPNIEYIIIDGGSNDESIQIIKKYEKKIAYWISEPDDGQTDAIIKGFKRASGSILTWLCSDDIYEPSMIKISVHYLMKHTDIGLTFGDRTRIDGKGNIYSYQRLPQFRKWHLKFGLTLPQETVLFKKSVYEESGGLNGSLHMAMDYDLWCKLMRITKLYHIPAFLGRFRAHSLNKSSQFSSEMNEASFDAGFPSEFAEVMHSHFQSRPSRRLMRIGNYFRSFQALIERRQSMYRKAAQEVKALQQ